MSSGTPEDQDREDMQRLVAGHDAALSALMTRHSERLFQFLVRALQNESEAGDLAEETFVRVYQNCQRYNSTQKFSTWLYAIAANLVRDRYRWRTRHPEVSADLSEEPGKPGWLGHLTDPGPSPQEALEGVERAEAVRQAISTLPEDLRTPLILAEYEGLSHSEIAEVVGGSPKAVEMRIYRARKLLREQLGHLLKQA